MSDYNEHLISMAGGDGDQLAEIEARQLDCQTYNFGMRKADQLAHDDVPYLLALAREQAAKLEAVCKVLSDAAAFGDDLDSADVLAAIRTGGAK